MSRRPRRNLSAAFKVKVVRAAIVKRQAELAGIGRASVYYLSRPLSAADLTLMRALDELHLQHPFAGARMLRDMLTARGISAETGTKLHQRERRH